VTRANYETERKFLRLPGRGPTPGLEQRPDGSLRPIAGVPRAAIADLYVPTVGGGLPRLRHRRELTPAGACRASWTAKVPAGDEGDTRLELEWPDEAGSRAAGSPYPPPCGPAGVLKVRLRAAEVLRGRAILWADLYALPAAPADLGHAVLDEAGGADMRRLLGLSEADLRALGAGGGPEYPYRAALVYEVEGEPDAVRAWDPPDGWEELTGRAGWSGGDLGTRGWPAIGGAR
jgi:hypothetical protein